MGNVCAWRQGKGKAEEDALEAETDNDAVKTFILKKENSPDNTDTGKNVIGMRGNENEENKINNHLEKQIEITKPEPEPEPEPFLLHKNEVENESKESKTTSENNVENNVENKETTIASLGIPITTENVSSGTDDDSDEKESDEGNEEDQEKEKQKENEILSVASTRQKRLSVSAEAYGEWNKKKENFVPKIYEKDEEEKKKIREAINESFLFSHLNDKEIETIVNAFFKKKVEKGSYIIKEGDDGDLLYVIDEGEVEIYKTKKIEETEDAVDEENKKEILTLLKSKDVFGELALLYNSKRAATAEALTDCSLWALDRESFNYIIKDTVAKNRQMYEDILRQVNVLKDMDPYERSKLADCLKSKNFKDGEIIIEEGEEGNTFYMLVDGHAVATKDDKIIKTYNKGDYFGELALLRNQPRAATVTCKDFCQVVYLDRKSFKRLLGPVEAILNRNVENYKQVLKELGLDTTCIEAN